MTETKMLNWILTAEQFRECPFCNVGVNVFQIPDPRYGDDAVSWVVECKNMGCPTGRTKPDQSLANLRADWNGENAEPPKPRKQDQP